MTDSKNKNNEKKNKNEKKLKLCRVREPLRQSPASLIKMLMNSADPLAPPPPPSPLPPPLTTSFHEAARD